jgi:hypothetical protein
MQELLALGFAARSLLGGDCQRVGDVANFQGS